MGDLTVRFGRLVAAHRKRAGMTQEALAIAADLSTDMITQIEAGRTGARFPSMERIADALRIDPAELLSSEVPASATRSKALLALHARIAGLSDRDAVWVDQLLDAALKPRG